MQRLYAGEVQRLHAEEGEAHQPQRPGQEQGQEQEREQKAQHQTSQRTDPHHHHHCVQQCQRQHLQHLPQGSKLCCCQVKAHQTPADATHVHYYHYYQHH
jgi:hypothetical protein